MQNTYIKNLKTDKFTKKELRRIHGIFGLMVKKLDVHYSVMRESDIFIIYCQNKPVGLITYNKYHICDFKFSGIIISKKYQNRGFATKLIKHAIEFGKNQNHKNIAVLSKEKSSLFENFGFKPFEKQYNVEKGYKFLKLDL